MSNFYTEPFVSAGEMEFPSQPYITAQPQNHTATGPEEYVLTVIAAGAVSYQWEVFDGESWSTIPGATSDTLTINIDSSMNGWRYRVIVTGADGSTVTSKAAQIAVKGVHEYTLEGAIVTFNGPARITSLTADINAIQSGSGDPSPTNIRPISGYSSVNVVRTGKNLFDKSAVTDGYYLNSNGTLAINNSYCISDYIPVNGTYHYNGATGFGTNPSTCYYDANKTFISGQHWTTAEGTKTPPDNAVWMRVSVKKADKDTFMLEYGDTASAYESFGTTYPISLGTTVYGGVLDVTSGVLTIDRVNVDLGTITWEASSKASSVTGYTFQSASVMTNGVSSGVVAPILCDKYTTKTNDNVYSGSTGIAVNTGGKFKMYDSAFTGTSTTDWKNYVSGVNVVYPLVTAQTVQLTAVEVTTLTGTNNIWADSGDVTLVYLA